MEIAGWLNSTKRHSTLLDVGSCTLLTQLDVTWNIHNMDKDMATLRQD